MGSRREFTRAELELAVDLHYRHQVPWADVAERLGRGVDSLTSTVHHFRHGRWQPQRRRQRVESLRSELERLVLEEGVTCTGEMARRVGSYRQHVNNHLRAVGLDAEMRRELAGGRAR